MRCSQRAWQLQVHESTPIEQPLYRFRRVETRRVVRGCDSGSPFSMDYRVGAWIGGLEMYGVPR